MNAIFYNIIHKVGWVSLFEILNEYSRVQANTYISIRCRHLLFHNIKQISCHWIYKNKKRKKELELTKISIIPSLSARAQSIIEATRFSFNYVKPMKVPINQPREFKAKVITQQQWTFLLFYLWFWFKCYSFVTCKWWTL